MPPSCLGLGFFMSKSEKMYLKLGSVGKARGLRGDFFVSGRDEPWPKTVKQVFIGRCDAPGAKVRSVVMAGQRIVLAVEGIGSREEAEKLCLQPIFCLRSAINVDSESEFLWQDLDGVPVVDSSGEFVGDIVGFENFGAHDNVIIRKDDQVLEVPFVSAWFAMDFTSRPERIEMLRPLSEVVDLWQKRR